MLRPIGDIANQHEQIQEFNRLSVKLPRTFVSWNLIQTTGFPIITISCLKSISRNGNVALDIEPIE
jgi:hypothetical protein